MVMEAAGSGGDLLCRRPGAEAADLVFPAVQPPADLQRPVVERMLRVGGTERLFGPQGEIRFSKGLAPDADQIGLAVAVVWPLDRGLGTAWAI